MDQALLVSHLALWAVVIALLVGGLVLARLVGVLYQRIPPRAARYGAAGPEIGQQMPLVEMTDLSGSVVTLPPGSDRSALLVFVSPTCRACRELAPALRSLAKSEAAGLDTILISLRGDGASNREFVREYKLGELPYVASGEVGKRLLVSDAPYALLIDPAGIVRAKGLVNRREDLESLLNAQALGYDSVESSLEDQHRGGHIGPGSADGAEGPRRSQLLAEEVRESYVDR